MTSGHGVPRRGVSQEPLYDTSVPTPSHGERARTLAATIRTATLATIAADPAGYPYGSFVTFALDEGHPVFLISDLAEHTRNLRGDPRASLLIAESRQADPLANGRVTLIGDCRRVTDASECERARTAFLAAHPNSAYYADFGDFGFWRLDVSAVRYIGGYGRMSWVDAAAFLAAECDPLAAHAARILDHMNADHADALALYCRAFSRATDTAAATMTAVDRYGFEMSATTAAGPRPIRLAFSSEVRTAEDARRELVDLVARARAALG